MKFKLDENLGGRTLASFQRAGHEAHTVLDEHLSGALDDQLYQTCVAEQRCLVTLDLDFADPLRFPPEPTGGIAVIRVPRNPSLTLLEHLVEQLIQAIEQAPLEHNLWVVEVGRIRIHQSSSKDT